MNYVKALLVSFIGIIVMSMFTTTLYYFDIISTNLSSIFNIIIPIVFIILGTIYLGMKTNKKGWLAGIKYSLLFLIIISLINVLIYREDYQLINILYYLIIILTSILGSMIGINLKKPVKD